MIILAALYVIGWAFVFGLFQGMDQTDETPSLLINLLVSATWPVVLVVAAFDRVSRA